MNNKKIYLKDIIKNKSYEELIQMLPFMVCRETFYEKNEKYNLEAHWRYESFFAIGFGKNSIILGFECTRYEEEPDFGGGGYTTYEYIEVPFDKLDDSYIFAHEPTQKQKDFIKKYTNEDLDCLCSYHAYKIISNVCEGWNNKKKATSEQTTHYYDYYDDDNDWFYDEDADPWNR